MKRQRHRLRRLVERAHHEHERQEQIPAEPEGYKYDDPREMAEVYLILARDAPETLPGASHDDFDDADEDELRRFAEVGCAESALKNPPDDPKARKRAAEGVAAIMKKYPEAWDLNGERPADYTEEELRKVAVSVMKQAADGPSPGEGPEPPENHS